MTNSIAFPLMFDVARNTVSVLEDKVSVVNRSRLLILSSPTELYNEPSFGVGISRHLWQYNTENEKAILRDRITAQIRLFEPSCDADATAYADGLLFTGNSDDLTYQDYNRMKLTVALKTIFGDVAEVSIDGE